MAFNLLIVDDSSSMRSMIRKTVEMSGFDVGEYFESANGAEALESLRSNWIDVVLSDLHMPIMDGLSFLKEVQSDELLKTIPVVVITTEGREQKVEEALSLGAKAYIRKPFTPEQVRNTLTQVIGAENVAGDQGDFDGCDF